MGSCSSRGCAMCGATLLNKRYAMTAMHCVEEASSLTVALGEHNIRADIESPQPTHRSTLAGRQLCQGGAPPPLAEQPAMSSKKPVKQFSPTLLQNVSRVQGGQEALLLCPAPSCARTRKGQTAARATVVGLLLSWRAGAGLLLVLFPMALVVRHLDLLASMPESPITSTGSSQTLRMVGATLTLPSNSQLPQPVDQFNSGAISAALMLEH